jgi:Flp pilus assembly protein protease CpaA
MLEEILFGQLSMPGEAIRVVLAFVLVGITAYYDLFNKKNVPDQVLYAMLAISFLVNLFFFQSDLFWFSLAIAAFFSAIGYLFYRIGQLGGADVFVLASVMLLLPLHPSFVGMTFNVPFVFSVIIFSGVAFALYVLFYYSFKLMETEAKPNLLYLLMVIPYALFAYVYINSFLFSPVYFAFISILLFASIFFLMFRDSLNKLLAEELPISQLEPEDVLALEIMNKDMIARYKIPRMVTKDEIERLKKTKVGEVWVYTRLPPFIPFIMLGMILAMLFAKSLLLLG